jgi:hypothetical protein
MKSTQATPEQLDRLARIVLESGLQGNEIPYLEKRLADMDIDCLVKDKRRFPDGILRGPDHPVLLPVHSAIPIAPEQMNRLFALVRQNGWGGTALDAFMEEVLPGQLPVGAEAPRIVTSVTVPLDYSLSFADLLAAGDYAEVMLPINEDNFPIKVRENGEHEFLVVSVKLQDDEDPAKSKLLWDLDRYGLQPEGAFELCTVGKHCLDLYLVGARGQLWRDPNGDLVYPTLHVFGQEFDDLPDGPRGIIPQKIGSTFPLFLLVSRKVSK